MLRVPGHCREITAACLVAQNLSGRLLVGLRWWNRIKDDGSSEWVYESHPNAAKRVPAMNSRIFWGGLYGAMVAWLSVGLLALLTIDVQWLLVCVTALSLTGANVTGYTRCSQQASAGGSSSGGGGGSGSGGVGGLSGLGAAGSVMALPGVLPAITSSISNSIFGMGATGGGGGGGGSSSAGGGLEGDVNGETVV